MLKKIKVYISVIVALMERKFKPHKYSFFGFKLLGRLLKAIQLNKLNMNSLYNFSEALENTIKDSNLKDITVDMAEITIDELLNDEILKDIPIIGTIIRLGKFSISIKDYLFIKKLIYFISTFKDIPASKRNIIISKIDTEDRYRSKVGEKLLFLIDKCNDHITSEYVAKFFKAFLEEKINYSEFLRCSDIVQKIFIDDFHHFLNEADLEKKVRNQEEISETTLNLINVGLCGSYMEGISIIDQWDYKSTNKYIVEGGETYIFITEIGKKILTILRV